MYVYVIWRILGIRIKNKEYAETNLICTSKMPDDFKGTVYRKIPMGDFKLA